MNYSVIWNGGILQAFFKSFTIGSATGFIMTAGAVILCIIIPYLLGSINVSIIISSKCYSDDIRLHGSGNAGMTNVMRTYGKKMAVITFAGDFAKAVISSLFGRLLFGYYGAVIAGLFCFLGHIFPCYYHFKGGKGVVTAAAMVLMTEWRAFIVLLLMFVVIVAVTKYVSLGSVVSMLLYPIVLDRLGHQGFSVLIAFIMGIMCAFAHRENIKRIMSGKESKLSFKSRGKKSDGESADVNDND